MRLIPWHLSGAADTYSPLLNLAHIESTSPLLPVLLSTCQMLCRLSTMRWRSSSASARAQEVKDYETYRSKHCLEGKQGIPARTLRPPWPVRWKPRPGDHTDAIRESPWPQRGWKWADKNLQQTRREAVWGWERPGPGEQQPVVATSPLWLHHVFTLVIAKTWYISVFFLFCLFSPSGDSAGLMKVACYFFVNIALFLSVYIVLV